MRQIVARNLGASGGRAILSAAGIALGIWVLTLIAALGLGTREIVLKELVRELPLDTVEVIPKTLDVGLFKIDTGSLLGAEALGPKVRDQLAQLPHVAAVYPVIDVPLPLGAQGGARLFGRRLYTDVFMTGLDPELVREDVGDAFVDNPDFVPVIISDQLIDIYNSTIAPSLGAPQLTAETLIGFEFELVVGRSMMLGSRGARSTGVERARIVGASQYSLRLGVSVPAATAQRLLARYGDGSAVRYKSILVRAESPSHLGAVAQGVESMGYSIDATAQKTRRILTAATFIASGVGAMVLLLAAMNIAHSFVASLQARRRELAILRAVGARKLDLVLLVLGEASTLGLVGGIAGLGAARLSAWAADAALHTYVSNLPFKAESFFFFPLWLHLAVALAAVLAAALGAIGPAWQAAKQSVATGLSE